MMNVLSQLPQLTGMELAHALRGLQADLWVATGNAGLLGETWRQIQAIENQETSHVDPALLERLRAAIASPKPRLPSVTRHSSLSQGLFTRSGRIAGSLWAARTEEDARTIFERWFYPDPKAPPTRLVDLGAWQGELTLELARRFPRSLIFAVDDDPGTLRDVRLPENVVPVIGVSFKEFDQRSFDRVYLVMPLPQRIEEGVEPAMKMVSEKGEIHILTEDLFAADRARFLMESAGFEVRRLVVPPDLVPRTTSIEKYRPHVRWFYWVVARRATGLPSFLPRHPYPSHDLPVPKNLVIGREVINNPKETRVQNLLLAQFRRGVPLEDLLWAFRVDVPGFRLGTLEIQKVGKGAVWVSGLIEDDAGSAVGRFTRIIERAPGEGEAWVAVGEGFHVWTRGPASERNRRQGLARALHQRFFTFLADLGVDRFEMGAQEIGTFVWAHIGFDFASRAVREDLKAEFRAWLERTGVTLSSVKDGELDSIRRAWELADFKGDDGRSLGKEFLLARGETADKGWKAVFHLRPDYPGWERLFRSSNRS